MYEQGKISKKAYFNLLSAEKRESKVTYGLVGLMLLCLVLGILGVSIFRNSLFTLVVGLVYFLIVYLIETYIGTKGMK